METWTEWGVERGIWDGWNFASRAVASMRNREEAEGVARNWAASGKGNDPMVVSRTVSASEWVPVTSGGEG